MPLLTVFLDMDGVCCNFQGAAMTACGFPDLVPTQWDMTRDMGITEDEFWRRIDAHGEDFWANLSDYPWFCDLYHRLYWQCQGRLYFLSTPSRAPFSASGKVRWLQKWLGPHFDAYIFTRHKHLFAGPGRLLVDDNAENCERFEAAGGQAILFPQPWNRAAPESFGPPWTISAKEQL